MNRKELEFILQQGEGQYIEFKVSFDKSLAKEIVAFANANGGRIFLGVDDKNRIFGCKLTNKLKSRIIDMVHNCDPKIEVSVSSFDNIVIIGVNESANKLHKCSSGFYLRQGANSVKLSRDEIREFFNKEGKILFDEMVHKNFSFKRGFDENKFNFFLEKAKISKVLPKKDILKNLGVLNDKEEFRNAGVLFFCHRVEEFIPQAVVTCVLYKGKDKVFIIDKKDFAADSYSNYQNAVEFLYRNLRLRYDIKGFGPRKEILEVPEDALKEALVNALAHRDYLEKGANVLVEIYDDRVEITNPGGLVSAIKKSEFGKKSFSRNPLLFSLFKRVDLVEKVGSGIGRMRRAMKEAGLPLPKFEFTNFFTVTFTRAVKRVETVGETVGKILALINENPKITREELSVKTGLTIRGVEWNIARLKQKGIIKRIGPAKGGHWEIIDK